MNAYGVMILEAGVAREKKGPLSHKTPFSHTDAAGQSQRAWWLPLLKETSKREVVSKIHRAPE